MLVVVDNLVVLCYCLEAKSRHAVIQPFVKNLFIQINVGYCKFKITVILLTHCAPQRHLIVSKCTFH